jgi:hypothetical protein
MDTRRLFALVAVLVATTAADSLAAAESRRDPIEGVYRLVSRKFDTGREMRPPEIEGRVVFTRGQIVAVIFNQTPSGQYETFARIAEYQLTPAEYRLTGGLATWYGPPEWKQVATEAWRGTSPVTRAEGRVEFATPQRPDAPIKPARWVFEQRGATSSVPGLFVDTWERVE